MTSNFINTLCSGKFWELLLTLNGILWLVLYLMGYHPLPAICYIIPLAIFYILVPLMIVTIFFRILALLFPSNRMLESLSTLIPRRKPIESTYQVIFGGLVTLLLATFWHYRYKLVIFRGFLESIKHADALVGAGYMQECFFVLGALMILLGLCNLYSKSVHSISE